MHALRSVETRLTSLRDARTIDVEVVERLFDNLEQPGQTLSGMAHPKKTSFTYGSHCAQTTPSVLCRRVGSVTSGPREHSPAR